MRHAYNASTTQRGERMRCNHPTIRERVADFCLRHGLRAPILLAPMAGACPPRLSIAVAQAGGMGACGALLMQPDEIRAWAAEMHAAGAEPFQMNLWIPDPAPTRDAAREAAVRALLAQWGPAVDAQAGNATPPDFDAQCAAILESGASVVSSIMGLYPPAWVERFKTRGLSWFATATTVEEALAAEAAGADAIVAQGMEAGGHRGAFRAERAVAAQVGLFSLVPAIADAVRLPVIATGGVADARGITAALHLGAAAVQIGTGFLRCPEARLPSAWADALARTRPEDTLLTRAFSGRPGRALVNDYLRAAHAPDAPEPAPYPVQRGLTAAMRAAATQSNQLAGMQAWAGQSAALAQARPAGPLLEQMWQAAQACIA